MAGVRARAALFLVAAALAGPTAAAPVRVFSLDQCADQFVLALSPRDAIVGLSPRVGDRDSYMRALSAGLPRRRASAEAVLAARPEVVVRYWGGDPALLRAVARRGAKVVQIDEAGDFAGVRANVRRVAAALGQARRGAALIARMDAQIRPHAGAGGESALYLTPSGVTAGPGTLVGAMLTAAGYRNLAPGPGYRTVSLERLALDPPRAFVLGFFNSAYLARQHWAAGGNHLLQKLIRKRTVVSLDGALLGCPAWFAGDAVQALAAAREPPVTSARLIGGLVLLLVALLALGIAFGETSLSLGQYRQAFVDAGSPAGEVLWGLRAPRVVAAAVVGAALGLAGAVMQGLLRNPLAEPGVLGVSGAAGLGAAVSITAGLAVIPGAIEAAALGGALIAGGLVVIAAARFREPETLILFGVALSAFAGALTALVFNLSPSPINTSDVLNWLMGSVANRDWVDIASALAPMAAGAGLCAYASGALVMLTLGEETAALSGLPMGRMRAAAVAGAALLTGAAVAMAGVIGFVGLAAPHTVRWGVGGDPGRVLIPSALSGACLVAGADLIGRLVPSEVELKLGVLTALFGAPLFALIAWRAARSWRA